MRNSEYTRYLILILLISTSFPIVVFGQPLTVETDQEVYSRGDRVLVHGTGAPDIEIIRYAKKNKIDVIVMGALGKSEQDRIVHGSTVANVSKFAHCHVIAIRNPAKGFTLPGKIT